MVEFKTLDFCSKHILMCTRIEGEEGKFRVIDQNLGFKAQINTAWVDYINALPPNSNHNV